MWTYDTPMPCRTLENKLYTLKHQDKWKQRTILDWLKNERYCLDFANECYLMNFILNSYVKSEFYCLESLQKIKHYYTV